MPPRGLTPFEQPIAAGVVACGLAVLSEFAAFLETPLGPLIEFTTDGHPRQVEPGLEVVTCGLPLVMHHNHLTQESLSSADWLGAVTFFDEVFAHCADGTVYWGTVRDPIAVRAVVARADAHLQHAEALLIPEIHALAMPRAVEETLVGLFAKEVVNRAMRLCRMVDYDVQWGSATAPSPHPGPGAFILQASVSHYAPQCQNALDTAAAGLAPSL